MRELVIAITAILMDLPKAGIILVVVLVVILVVLCLKQYHKYYHKCYTLYSSLLKIEDFNGQLEIFEKKCPARAKEYISDFLGRDPIESQVKQLIQKTLDVRLSEFHGHRKKGESLSSNTANETLSEAQINTLVEAIKKFNKER